MSSLNDLADDKLQHILMFTLKKLALNTVDITEVEALSLQQYLKAAAGNIKLIYSESLDVLRFLAVLNMPSNSSIRERFRLNSSKLGIIEQVWKDNRHLLCNDATTRLTDLVTNSDWITHIEVGNHWCSRHITPITLLQIASENSHEQKDDILEVEFSHESLYHFLIQLDAIQAQLDEAK
uniref:AlNc14C44G3637 protein n=1 Tax=Albugo laibachii Nc14 TaxID=890382 RepID=F0WAA8_9STRA|nr:AlNc14C44G3637 [Albugo laibachii Nc14]|eukprot:CCA18078.1 AlNc14C44G3637 [Albugo laibachii Nc14]